MTFAEITETIGTPALDLPRGDWAVNDDTEAQHHHLEDEHAYTVACLGTFRFGEHPSRPKAYLLDSVDGGRGIYQRVGIAPGQIANPLDHFNPKM